MKTRGFEAVSDRYRWTDLSQKINIPVRATQKSAGYDFRTPVEINLLPGEECLIKTDIKAYMLNDEYLDINIRSSIGSNGLRIKNLVGIIDADYYNNPKNDGNIQILLINESKYPKRIMKNERIVQGIFKKYLITDDDKPIKEKREGGIGSSGKR